MMGDITLSFDGDKGETIRIDASPSRFHPHLCTFTSSHPLYPDWSAHFAAKDQSKGSPLVDRLFDLGLVFDVLVAADTVTVTFNEGADMEKSIPKVGQVIRDVLVSGESPISAAVTDAMLPKEELQSRIQKILDDTVNPAIASHGGFVNLVGVSNNSAFLELAGGCHGCGMANVTLKYGVERAIREQIPGVGEILDTTDHASGRNPYYKSPE